MYSLWKQATASCVCVRTLAVTTFHFWPNCWTNAAYKSQTSPVSSTAVWTITSFERRSIQSTDVKNDRDQSVWSCGDPTKK